MNTGLAASTAALGRDDDGTPDRDFAKWLKEQPERSADEMEARIMKLQDDMRRGVIDFAGFPIATHD